MRFEDYYYLFLLILVPLIAWIYLKKSKPISISYSSLKLFKKNFETKSYRNELFLFIRLFIISLLILAFARPQKGLVTSELKTKGIDIVLCIDTSTSMRALDFKPKNRLDVAKEAAKEFVKARVNDRIGIVVFSGLSFTQCPLTTDRSSLIEFLDKVEIGMTQLDGTAIGSAIMTCINRLKDSPAKSKVIILLTDGRNNMGEVDPITAAKAAQSVDIKIYTIGIGIRGKSLYPVEDPIFGTRYVYLQEDLDEGLLTQIANITNGKYFRAKSKQELFEIYSQIDKLEKTEIKKHQYTQYYELYRFFVLPAFILLICEILSSNTIFIKIP